MPATMYTLMISLPYPKCGTIPGTVRKKGQTKHSSSDYATLRKAGPVSPIHCVWEIKYHIHCTPLPLGICYAMLCSHTSLHSLCPRHASSLGVLEVNLPGLGYIMAISLRLR